MDLLLSSRESEISWIFPARLLYFLWTMSVRPRKVTSELNLARMKKNLVGSVQEAETTGIWFLWFSAIYSLNHKLAPRRCCIYQDWGEFCFCYDFCSKEKICRRDIASILTATYLSRRIIKEIGFLQFLFQFNSFSSLGHLNVRLPSNWFI